MFDDYGQLIEDDYSKNAIDDEIEEIMNDGDINWDVLLNKPKEKYGCEFPPKLINVCSGQRYFQKWGTQKKVCLFKCDKVDLDFIVN